MLLRYTAKLEIKPEAKADQQQNFMQYVEVSSFFYYPLKMKLLKIQHQIEKSRISYLLMIVKMWERFLKTTNAPKHARTAAKPANGYSGNGSCGAKLAVKGVDAVPMPFSILS